jgi:transposase
MLDFMERSTVHLLSKRGNTNAQIAQTLGRDPKTVRKTLEQPPDRTYQREKPGSLVDAHEAKILGWIIEGIPVTAMLRRAREDETTPYTGGRSIFYERVKLIRQTHQISNQEAVWRFEGLPGEYLQVDWGETRHFPFTRIAQQTRYCFVCRLKYSRWVYAEFHDTMRYETLIRCMLRGFESLGGVPWVLVFDNMRTVTTGRNPAGQPIWNPKFLQFAQEIGFHPELCFRYAPNQKGTGAFLSWGTSFSAEMPAHLVPRPCFLSTHPTPTCHRIGGGTLLPRLSFVIENLSLLVSEGARPLHSRCDYGWLVKHSAASKSAIRTFRLTSASPTATFNGSLTN